MRDTEQLKAKYGLILREREKHGDQSVEDFCNRHGITPWRYYYWKKRLRKAADNFPPLRKVVPLQLTPSSRVCANDGSVIDSEIKFSNGTMMRISGTIQREDFLALIETVAAVQS